MLYVTIFGKLSVFHNVLVSSQGRPPPSPLSPSPKMIFEFVLNESEDVKKTASVAFLMPYSCSEKNFLLSWILLQHLPVSLNQHSLLELHQILNETFVNCGADIVYKMDACLFSI